MDFYVAIFTFLFRALQHSFCEMRNPLFLNLLKYLKSFYLFFSRKTQLDIQKQMHEHKPGIFFIVYYRC